MYNHWIIKVILPACLVCLSVLGMAQDAESIRAQNFLTLQRLLALKAIAPYYLTAADQAQIQQLQGQTQTQVCQSVTTASCSPVAAPAASLQLAGERTSTEQAQLAWETVAAYNSQGFVLERQSVTNPLQFDSVLFVTSAATPKSTYRYSDLNRYTGNSFYRVKQVDTDGKVTYSNVVMVEGYSGKFEMSVAPNPATGPTVRVYFRGLDLNQTMRVIVSSSAGKQLLKKDNVKPNSGDIELNSQLLSSGYYFVTVYTNGGVYTKSFSVVN